MPSQDLLKLLKDHSGYKYHEAVKKATRSSSLLGYQLDGNLVSRTRNGATTTYTYDKANRLQSETADGVTTTYAYDLRGNRTRKTVGTDVTTYTSNLANQLLSEGGTTYQYDANGNLTSKSGAENESYTYDLLGRLKSYSVIGGSASYTYDGGGLRQTKTLGTTTTQYIWDGNNLISENWGSDQRQYIYGRRLISMYTPGADQREYYQYDEHGSVTSLYNLVGRCHADYTYDAFGNQSEGGAFYNPFRYSGEYTDAESGMVYLRARYYDPSVGRFISEDPVKDGGNWYAYCANNPVNFIDPSGLAPGDIFETDDLAAQDWGEYYYSTTEYTLLELSSFIYEIFDNDDGSSMGFSYTFAIIGGAHSAGGFWDGLELVPENGTDVGYIHSHPNGFTFSTKDKNIAEDCNISAYVVVPGRTLRKWESSVNADGKTVWGERRVATDLQLKGLSIAEQIALTQFYKSQWDNHLTNCKSGWFCEEKTWPKTGQSWNTDGSEFIINWMKSVLSKRYHQ